MLAATTVPMRIFRAVVTFVALRASFRESRPSGPSEWIPQKYYRANA
jgi:hypothetical protein